jgi:hypothetical protein
LDVRYDKDDEEKTEKPKEERVSIQDEDEENEDSENSSRKRSRNSGYDDDDDVKGESSMRSEPNPKRRQRDDNHTVPDIRSHAPSKSPEMEELSSGANLASNHTSSDAASQQKVKFTIPLPPQSNTLSSTASTSTPSLAAEPASSQSESNNKLPIDYESRDTLRGVPLSRPTKEMLKDYTIPKYFTDDLFQYTGSRRPPHRWIVIGTSRSGTGIHIDPLGTSAWNALVFGHKRWALFPPHVPKSLVTMRGLPDHEAASWFAIVYPRLFDETTRDEHGRLLADRLGLVDILQRPGETVFVPGGWHHVVINLDFTVAVTQNFCSRTNFEEVWLRTRYSRPKLAQKLLKKLESLQGTMGDLIPAAPYFAGLVEKAKCLETVPACQPSTSSSSGGSTSSSSSSSSDTDTEARNTVSESSDEEGRCMCRKCKVRRRRRLAAELEKMELPEIEKVEQALGAEGV